MKLDGCIRTQENQCISSQTAVKTVEQLKKRSLNSKNANNYNKKSLISTLSLENIVREVQVGLIFFKK